MAGVQNAPFLGILQRPSRLRLVASCILLVQGTVGAGAQTAGLLGAIAIESGSMLDALRMSALLALCSANFIPTPRWLGWVFIFLWVVVFAVGVGSSDPYLSAIAVVDAALVVAWLSSPVRVGPSSSAG